MVQTLNGKWMQISKYSVSEYLDYVQNGISPSWERKKIMNTLNKLIEEKGMDLNEISSLTGINIFTIYQYIETKNLIYMPVTHTCGLAKALGVNAKDLFDPITINENLIEGWNKILPNFKIYIENEQIIKGMLNGHLVFPFLPSHDGGFDNVSGISVSKLNELLWF